MSLSLSALISLSLIMASMVESQQDVVCSEYRECYRSTITANGTVTCSGYESCYRSTITSNGTVTCSDSYSCYYSKITTRADVQCTGSSSCRPEKWYPWNKKGARRYSIIAGGIVNCSGDAACIYAKIKSDTGVYLGPGGRNGWGNSRITIRSPYVESSGYDGWRKAVFVDSGEYPTLTVRIRDEKDSGRTGRVLCRPGATCNLSCESQVGCKRLRYECEEGATCNIEPAACANSTNWNKYVIAENGDRILCPREISPDPQERRSAMSDVLHVLGFNDDEKDNDKSVTVNEKPMETMTLIKIAAISAVTSMIVMVIAYFLCVKPSTMNKV